MVFREPSDGVKAVHRQMLNGPASCLGEPLDFEPVARTGGAPLAERGVSAYACALQSEAQAFDGLKALA